MKVMNKLTARAIAKAAPNSRHGDGGGLWLQVDRFGNKSWIYRYTIGGRARAMGLGPCHTVSLATARGLAREARLLLIRGIDPLDAKHDRRKRDARARASRMTFRQCADAYLKEHSKKWTNVRHVKQWQDSLESAASAFGPMDVSEIDTNAVIKFLQPRWAATPETASRVRGRIEQILNWAKARKFREGENPAAWRGQLEHLLAAKPGIEHHAALPYAELPEFMGELREREGVAARALELCVLACARTSEVLGARWGEFDLKEKVWTIPAERMKGRKAHRVPLSDRAISLIDRLPRSDTDLLFPGRAGDKPMNERALLIVAKSMRSGITTHGFRSSFSDWARERTNFARDVVEMALAHSIKDRTEAAYRRGDALPKRAHLMQLWADFCSAPAVTADNVRAIHG
jgi:integrase